MADIRFTSEITVTPLRVLGNDQFVIGSMKVMDGIPDIPYRESEAGRKQHESDRGRIRYLMEHRHGTPFEHNCIILHVHAPVFVWREWHRHRIGFSYNEESARYKQLEPVFFIPARDRPMVKIATEKWKAGRPKFATLTEDFQRRVEANEWGVRFSAEELTNSTYGTIIDDMKQGHIEEYARYERQLARNLDPGLARDNLPVGIYSSCWVTCNLRSALAFLSLRTHEPAAKFVSYPLYEIEQGARQLEACVKENFPLCHEAFCDFGRVGP